MYIEDKWIEQASKVMKLQFGNKISDKEIHKFLKGKFKENFKDMDVVIENSYEREITPFSLAGVLDWIQTRKPVVTEAGTFFKRPDEGRGLHAQIVFNNLMNREIFKAEMFRAEDAKNMILAKFKNQMQTLEKLRANAPYGVDGNPYSFSYNFNVSSSTTFAGRGQTSMACLNFENIMNDFVKFDYMDEMFTYVLNVLSEKDEWIFKTFDILNIIPSKKDLVNRLVNKFDIEAVYYLDQIENMVDNLSESERSRVFYKSNFRDFLMNDSIRDLFTKFVDTDAKFENPYKPEDNIKAELRLLVELLDEFVGYKHQTFRYEDKARHKQRAAVIVMDTDSNIIYIGNMVKFIKTKVLRKRFLFKDMNNIKALEVKLVNLIASFLTESITNTINHYLSKINVDNTDNRVAMKNEFAYGYFVVTKAKKAYMGGLERKEGLVYKKPKIDLKGATFAKSSSTPKTTEYIMEEILKDKLIFPKDGKIDIFKIKKAIDDYKVNMKAEISSGDLSYHKRSVKVKSEYANPFQQQLKAVNVWNFIYPNQEIELPNTVTTIKVKLYKRKDLALLEDYPEIYDRFQKLFDSNEHYDSKGITTIAIPYDSEEIPEWLIRIMDIDTIINDNMSLFSQLYEPLNLGSISATHTASKKTLSYNTNIIKI